MSDEVEIDQNGCPAEGVFGLHTDSYTEGDPCKRCGASACPSCGHSVIFHETRAYYAWPCVFGNYINENGQVVYPCKCPEYNLVTPPG